MSTREILFRGKRINNGKWVEGYYFKNENGTFIFTFPYHANYAGIDVMVKVYPETVCQYTGLNDKNEKKIFEGDIVSVPDFRFNVCFLGGCFGAYFEDGFSPMCTSVYGYGKGNTEVIGNILDNPELLN